MHHPLTPRLKATEVSKWSLGKLGCGQCEPGSSWCRYQPQSRAGQVSCPGCRASDSTTIPAIRAVWCN
eukprot:symbB.v1.2.019934.t1/scaffold1652.1/size121070/14